MTPDLFNGLFEFSGSLFILNHCRVLYKQKMVRGASKLATAFFSSWGLWNLYYYPSLDQVWSFRGGCAIVTANSLWLGMMVYYALKEKQCQKLTTSTSTQA